MKLTVFSAHTLPNKQGGGKSNKARISFAPKGKIAFSMPAAQLIGLKKGDTVSLAQDDTHPDRWYFYKDKAGFELQEINRGGLIFCHRELVTTFLEAWDYELDKTHKMVVDSEPVAIKGDKTGTQYWLIKPL